MQPTASRCALAAADAHVWAAKHYSRVPGMRVEQDDITSLIIPVPEAAFVQPFRVKYLQRPSVTMPPHVTLHAPFKLRSAMDQKVLSALAQLFAAQGQFRFTLARTVRFSETGVFYLTP
jgi:hypothetical protein